MHNEFMFLETSMEFLNRINLLSFHQIDNAEDIDEDALGLSNDTSSVDLHSLPNLLGKCIVEPIKWQTSLVNR